MEEIYPKEKPKKTDGFDVEGYANAYNTIAESDPAPSVSECDDDAKAMVVALLNKIEERGIDITGNYEQWRNIGFGLVQLFGEEGRKYFHRISRLSAKYDQQYADQQYTAYTRSSNGSVTYKSMLLYANQAGIPIAEIAHEVKHVQQGAAASTANPPLAVNIENSTNNNDLTTFDYNNASGGSGEVAVTALLPTFSDKLQYDALPLILQKIYDTQDTAAHRDKMLLGAITLFSGLMGMASYYGDERSGIYGIYDGDMVFAPLYTMIYGSPSSGKGPIKYCRYLASEIRQEVVGKYKEEMEQYEQELNEWKAQNQGKNRSGTPAPKEPEYRDVFIPGNSSASFYQVQLCNNGGSGITLETEGETISSMFKSEYGDYSALWCKSFHHEVAELGRRMDNLRVEAEKPRLAILVTQTPGQLASMFDTAWDSGLGSRFIFYYLPSEKLHFRNVFARKDRSMEDVYKEIGRQFTPLYHALQQRQGHPIHFVMSQQQEQYFLDFFSDTLSERYALLGEGSEAMVYRFGLMNFRIAMVLSALRRLDQANPFEEKPIFDDDENAMICDERDFQTAMTMMEAIIEHNSRVFSVLNKEQDNPFANKGIKLSPVEIRLYTALPDSEFETKDFIAIAKQLSVPERTAERMLGEMCSRKQIIVRVRRGVYVKVQASQQ